MDGFHAGGLLGLEPEFFGGAGESEIVEGMAGEVPVELVLKKIAEALEVGDGAEIGVGHEWLLPVFRALDNESGCCGHALR